jgi:lipopolysaccharide/colanic/teichoic acid biosynthesis glycosyltransferase
MNSVRDNQQAIAKSKVDSRSEHKEHEIELALPDPVELESKWPPKFHQRFIKRVIDILISLTLFAALLPLMIVVGILIMLTSRGPAVYKQKRLTLGGRYFVIYKFRTIARQAEKKSGIKMADEGDERVTLLGRILRKTRIDELPQLLNVVIGDMSLIGPRPERPEIAQQLKRDLPHIHQRVNVKAGLTGLAQVNLGYVSTPENYRQKLAWDIYYIDNYSLLLDIKIALKTIKVILTGFGAR